VLIASHRACVPVSPLTFSLAVHPPRSLPRSLNGFASWMLLVVALTDRELRLPDRAVAAAQEHGVRAIRCKSMKNDPRFAIWIGGTVVLFLVAGVVGFVWLPRRSPARVQLICGPSSVARSACRSAAQRVLRGAGQPASDVAWTAAHTRRLRGRRRSRRALATPATTATARTASARRGVPEPGRPSVACDLQATRGLQERQAQPDVMGVFVAPLSRRTVCSTSRRTLPRCRIPFASGACRIPPSCRAQA
jgi:hypothetical protein